PAVKTEPGVLREASGEVQAKDPGDAAQQEAKHREAETRNCISAQVLSQSAPGQVKTRFNRNP
uniref:Uncharacterized protein n=1 Tax=Theropithecus gelada TaxID=9565 RepID=A0A8D2FZF8_THEGE